MLTTLARASFASVRQTASTESTAAHHPAAAVQVGDGAARALRLVHAHGDAAGGRVPHARDVRPAAREVLGLGEVRGARLVDRHLVPGPGRPRPASVEDALQLGIELLRIRAARGL